MRVLHSTISSTTYNRAYLVRAWDQRVGLQDYERYGFAQFFYLTVTGHVEASMAEVMERRLMYMRTMFSELRDKSLTWKVEEKDVSYPYTPLYKSLQGAVGSFEERLGYASLESLSQMFQELFDVKLKELMGDLNPDLQALAKLRNVFAHGRGLWLQYENTDDNLLVLDQNPLQQPAQRLLGAGILKTLRVSGREEQAFRAAFYGDAALLYFLEKARAIEERLQTVLVFPPEREVPLMVRLPELHA